VKRERGEVWTAKLIKSKIFNFGFPMFVIPSKVIDESLFPFRYKNG